MRTLVIAIGNPLRRDDGAAHHVSIPPGADSRAVLQLTPEIAEEIAGYDSVVFLDADVAAKQVQIEPVDSLPLTSALTHVSRPAEIVAIARALFGFTGRAYTCRIPVSDLSQGEGLTPLTETFAQQASRALSDGCYTVTGVFQSDRHAREHPCLTCGPGCRAQKLGRPAAIVAHYSRRPQAGRG